jgi:AsmA-like C-terminal region
MLKKTLVVLAALAVVAVFLLSRDWDSPELGSAILEKVSAATGIQVKAEGFRLNVLKGVVLEKVEARSKTEGRELTLDLDRLVFEHRLLPLLRGTVAVDRVLLEKPTIVVVQTKTGPSSSKKAEGSQGEPKEGVESESGGGLAFDLKRIQIEDGSLSVKNSKGEEKSSVTGLDLELRNVLFDPEAASLAAISGDGTLGAREMVFDTLHLTETEGEFQLSKAVFTIPELSFLLPNGKFTADAKLDFNPVPFTYTMNARGEPLDVNGMVGATEGFGPGTLKLEAKGAGPETKDLKGDGQVRLAEGNFPNAKMFRDLEAVLGKTALLGSSYKATEASFRMENDRVILAPFRFESGDARLDLSGTMSLDGPIDFDLSLATPREGLKIEGASSSVLDLLADDQGWVAVPIAITGTLEDPKVRPDLKALASHAGRGAQREVTEKATDALRGLLKKKKE